MDGGSVDGEHEEGYDEERVWIMSPVMALSVAPYVPSPVRSTDSGPGRLLQDRLGCGLSIKFDPAQCGARDGLPRVFVDRLIHATTFYNLVPAARAVVRGYKSPSSPAARAPLSP